VQGEEGFCRIWWRMEVGTSEEGEDWSTRSIEMMVEHMILAGEASSAGGEGFVEGEEEEEEEEADGS